MSNTPYYFERDYGLKRVTKANEVPTKPHYAILIYSTFSHMERGYDRNDPDYSVSTDYIEQYVTESETHWKDAISALYAEDMKRKDVVAYVVSAVPTVKPSVMVSIT